jgi:hypothetical protein
MPVAIIAAIVLMLGFLLVSVGMPQARGNAGVATFDRVTVLVLAVGALLIAVGFAIAFLHLPLLRPFWLLYFGGSAAIWVIAALERDDGGFSPSAFLTSALLAVLVLRLLIVHFRA